MGVLGSIGRGLTKVGKYVAPAVLMATGVGAPAAMAAYRGLDTLDKGLSAKHKQAQAEKQMIAGRGINPSAGMMQGRGMGGQMGGAQQRMPFNVNMPHRGQGMDQMITQGRNSVNPSWFTGGFNPYQPHPMQGMMQGQGGGFGGGMNQQRMPIQNMMQNRMGGNTGFTGGMGARPRQQMY